MIALIQRVTKAKVVIKNKTYSEIKNGYIILLGIFKQDTEQQGTKLANKITNLRIMSDKNKKMNQSILDTQGEILVVSQFTLCADTNQGRRPSFIKAKEPKEAKKLYHLFCQKLKEKNLIVKTGKFSTHMEVQIFNDGPVTIILSEK